MIADTPDAFVLTDDGKDQHVYAGFVLHGGEEATVRDVIHGQGRVTLGAIVEAGVADDIALSIGIDQGTVVAGGHIGGSDGRQNNLLSWVHCGKQKTIRVSAGGTRIFRKYETEIVTGGHQRFAPAFRF